MTRLTIPWLENVRQKWKENGMSDFKQRLADWREYKQVHKKQFLIKDVVMDADLGLRSMSWFLLQFVEQRKKREQDDIEALERILEAKRVEITQKKKMIEA